MPNGRRTPFWHPEAFASACLDTLSFMSDERGNPLPINRPGVLPFVATGDEFELKLRRRYGLLNAASFQIGVSRGALATLIGSGFTDVEGVQPADSNPLPTEIGGVSVKLNGRNAPLLAVAKTGGREQINFQVPHSLDSPFEIVVENKFKRQVFYSREWTTLGLFSTVLNSEGALVTESAPVAPGAAIRVFWTGLEPYQPPEDGHANPAGLPCRPAQEPGVMVSGRAAVTITCAAAPGMVGIGQIVVRVPEDLDTGAHDLYLSYSPLSNRIPVFVKRP